MLTMPSPSKTWIIAEAGNNHEGSFALAKELVAGAKEAGADAVKFQTFKTELFQSKHADSARFERLQKFRLSHEQFAELSAYANKLGIGFFSTPLDEESIPFLAKLSGILKIASGDNNCISFLQLAARQKTPLILSTGMLDLSGIRAAVQAITSEWKTISHVGDLTVLHCVSAYPAPASELNLRAIQLLQKTFPEHKIGYSDHCLGIEASLAAVACGAKVIEKHFTINKAHSDFRDHALSADIPEFSSMVSRIRALETMLGREEKSVQASEQPVIAAARRSLAAREDLAEGTVLNEKNTIWLRPGSGLSPDLAGKAFGKKLKRALKQSELISEGSY